MPTYGDVLVAEQLLQTGHAIDKFLDSYVKNQRNPEQRTVIFFPGGMGSELVRADRPFDPLLGLGSYGFQPVWVDFWKLTIDQGALLLQMNGNQDSGGQFMVSDGSVKFFGRDFYSNFERWCEVNNLDLLMVGWDFRRGADWNVDFFLGTLLPEVRRRAALRGLDNGPGDFFKGATLVGHSFGGMLVKWILNRHADPFCQALRLAVTVAAPFYGSAGQMQRLLTSMSPLTEPLYNLDAVTKVIATFPGCYALFFLDKATYATYGGALGHDPQYPLLNYPCLDVSDHLTPVDPFDPPAPNPLNPNLYRYPIKSVNPGNDWPWFAGYLAQGLADCKALAVPLDPSVKSKMHNFRAVQTSKGAVASNTDVGFLWGWYDVTKPRSPQASGVVHMTTGPGDSVVPAWSARLVTQDPANVHTITGDLDEVGGVPALDHMTLMDCPAVRLPLLDLIRPGTEQIVVQIFGPKPAAVTDYNQVMQQLQYYARTLPPDEARKLSMTYVNGLSPELQQAIALRWFIEAPKGTTATGNSPR
jgi:pimeloyl-ACP methyl ester carboxylesterase